MTSQGTGGEALTEHSTKKYVVLVCGLNIRDHNRITMVEQQLAHGAVKNDLSAKLVGDKGSYLITTQHQGQHVVDLVANALQTSRPDLEIPGAAVASPAAVEQALAEMATALATKYGKAFIAEDYGVGLNGNTRRAGLALPLSPVCFTAVRSLFHQIKNAMIFGWAPRQYPRRQGRGEERTLGNHGNRSGSAAAAATRGCGDGTHIAFGKCPPRIGHSRLSEGDLSQAWP